MASKSPVKKTGKRGSSVVFNKDDPLLKVVDLELNGIPEVGTLVWARVEGSVYWPAFLVQEYRLPENVNESVPPEDVSVIFMEKRFRAARVKWSRVILAEMPHLSEQTSLITALNRTLGKKGWTPNRAYNEGLKLWEGFQQIEASLREKHAEELFEAEFSGKQRKRLTEDVPNTEEVSPKRRFSEPTLQKKSNKLIRTKNRRYSFRSPTAPNATKNDSPLPLASNKLKESENSSKTDLNNHPNGANPGSNPLAIINKKTGRPLHGGEFLKQWTQQQFNRIDKKFVFDSSPDIPCAKCKLGIQNESPMYCHDFPFHKDCLIEVGSVMDEDGQEQKVLKCEDCTHQNCFVCKKPEGAIKCSKCPLKFHRECLKKWPQAVIQGMQGPITCPLHFCHTCKAEQRCLSKMRNTRLVNNKAYRCIHCLSAYHKVGCLPAGCAETISGHAFIECPKHTDRIAIGRKLRRLGCFSCNKRLIEKDEKVECTTCYMIFHPECIGYTDEERAEGIRLEKFAENFQCNSCCWGLFPLYGQVVWFQQPGSSFWPARILYPKESAVRGKENKSGLYSIVYFGSQSTYFDNVLQSVPFHIAGIEFLTKLNLYNEKPALLTAYEEAGYALTHSEEHRDSLLPKPEPDYKRTDRNVYRDGKRIDVAKSNKGDAMVCNCDQLTEPYACVPNSGCYNRDSSVECNKSNCSAPDKCKNRMFSLPNKTNDHLEVFATAKKGWGVKATRKIAEGEFIIEYVGEVISRADMSWRVGRKNDEDPRYILDLGSNSYIDAEYVGNISRLINHSCSPNCATLKYSSSNRPVVGVFAKRDIEPGEELTFNYAYDKDGSCAPFRCYCGVENCKGYIDRKVTENEENYKPNLKRKLGLEEEESTKETEDRWNNNCEVCTFGGRVILCDYKDCRIVFHLKCAGLKKAPRGRWVCPFHPPEPARKRKKSLKKKLEVEVATLRKLKMEVATPENSASVMDNETVLEQQTVPLKTSDKETKRKMKRSPKKETNVEIEATPVNSPAPIKGGEAVTVLDQIPCNLSHVTPKLTMGESEALPIPNRKSAYLTKGCTNKRQQDRSKNIDTLRRKNSSILLKLLSSPQSSKVEDDVKAAQKYSAAPVNGSDAAKLFGQSPPAATLPTFERSNSSNRVQRSSPRIPERVRSQVTLRNRTLQYQMMISRSIPKISIEVETEATAANSLGPTSDSATVNVLDQILPSNVTHSICGEQSSSLSKRKSKLKRGRRCNRYRSRSEVSLRSNTLHNMLHIINTSV